MTGVLANYMKIKCHQSHIVTINYIKYSNIVLTLYRNMVYCIALRYDYIIPGVIKMVDGFNRRRIAEVFEDLATEVAAEIVVLEDFLALNPEVTVLPNLGRNQPPGLRDRRTITAGDAGSDSSGGADDEGGAPARRRFSRIDEMLSNRIRRRRGRGRIR